MRTQQDILCALLIAAPSHQGGHSYSGRAIAKALGVPFPLTMRSLRSAAIDCGFDPVVLWPWMAKAETAEQLHPKAYAESVIGKAAKLIAAAGMRHCERCGIDVTGCPDALCSACTDDEDLLP